MNSPISPIEIAIKEVCASLPACYEFTTYGNLISLKQNGESVGTVRVSRRYTSARVATQFTLRARKMLRRRSYTKIDSLISAIEMYARLDNEREKLMEQASQKICDLNNRIRNSRFNRTILNQRVGDAIHLMASDTDVEKGEAMIRDLVKTERTRLRFLRRAKPIVDAANKRFFEIRGY